MTAAPPPAAAPGSDARAGLVALTGAAILWGSIGVVVRFLQIAGLSSPAIAFWRFAVAAVVLVPLVGRRGLAALAHEVGRPGRLLAVSTTSLAFQLLYIFAVRDVGAGIATLVTLGVAPVVLYAAESVLRREPPRPRTVGVLVLALAGLLLVTTGPADPAAAPQPVLGAALSVASGLAYAFATLWSRPLLGRLSPLPITLANSAVGVVALAPILALVGWSIPRTAFDWGNVVWLGLVTTIVAYGLFYLGLRSITGSTAAVVTLLEPVTAVVLAALLLGEPITVTNVLGGGLLLVAVATLYLRPPRGSAAGDR